MAWVSMLVNEGAYAQVDTSTGGRTTKNLGENSGLQVERTEDIHKTWVLLHINGT